jgi:hypothetical protein
LSSERSSEGKKTFGDVDHFSAKKIGGFLKNPF